MKRRRRRAAARLAVSLGALAVAAPVPAQESPAQDLRRLAAAADHVILVSIDGFRPEFYLEERWPAPVIRRGARTGAWSPGVRSVFPTVTYPSHTTMITGALPATHGILYNTPFEPGGQTGRWYWEEVGIQVPTLWDAVDASGGTTASLAWPVSVGAPVTWNLPEIWPLDEASRRATFDRHATPAGLVEELEAEATGRLHTWSDHGPVEPEWDRPWWDERMARAAEYLIERRRPTLLTLHVVSTDGAQHDRGREHPEVHEAVALADRIVGRLQEAAERAGILDRTAFVVTGDHGFVDLSTELRPNVWLAEAGLLEMGEDRGDWRAAFHVAGGSAFLHLAEPTDAETTARVRQILDALPASTRRLFRVLDAGEIAASGGSTEAALALSAERGVAFSGSTREPALAYRDGGTHGFHPELHPDILTGFVAWGAGIRSGAVAPEMGLEDVAPLVAALLGLDFSAPDGVLRPGLLEEAQRPS